MKESVGVMKPVKDLHNCFLQPGVVTRGPQKILRAINPETLALFSEDSRKKEEQ